MRYDSVKAFGDCEGPLGFPMKSAIARAVEDVLAGLDADCRERVSGGPVRLSAPAEIRFEPGERADISFVTTGALDRDREVVLPAGGDWSQFRKNPVVTFAHDYRELPVGRCLWVKRKADALYDGWLAKTRYTDRPENWDGSWLPDGVWHMVRRGELPGKSIGFIPLQMRPPTPEEIRQRPELAQAARVIARWLALEYAVVPVQSNPDALVQAVAKAYARGERPAALGERVNVATAVNESIAALCGAV